MDNEKGVKDDKYVPNTTPAEIVVKERKFEEPKPCLLVEYQCPMCDAVRILDAYLGVPRCLGGRVSGRIEYGDNSIPPHRPIIMKGLSIHEEILNDNHSS